MRVLVLFACALVASVQGLGGYYSEDRQLGQIHVQCITDSKINPDAVRGLRDDPRLIYYVGCVYRRLGIITDTGDIDIVNLQAAIINRLHVNRYVAEEAVRRCHTHLGWSPEQSAYQIENCIYDTFQNHIVLIQY